MKKNFGAETWLYPMPVFIIGTYNEDGTPNAMNAAWGGTANSNKIAICVDRNHKTTENFLGRKAFTVAIADETNVVPSDYVGIVSCFDVPDKISRAGLTPVKSEFVDAPVFEEYRMTLECRVVSYDNDSELLIGEIVNIMADESVLAEDGQIDIMKLKPISFDPVHSEYHVIGDKVGNAFSDGKELDK
ncbi:MAG: flavin reductase family protein [Firmicutes bacterium]|nr:flavin reductase family protein [Bacillota bacterium]